MMDGYNMQAKSPVVETAKQLDLPTSPDQRLDKTLRVTEIFKSVQGESTWAGMPCIFVRLARCPLRCVWCDTDYAFRGGDPMSIGDIVAQCRDLACSLVEITGGEPLVQKDSVVLASCLLEEGWTVLVETSGSLPIDALPRDAIKIMDLKCPGSGECAKNYWPNIEALSTRDEVKFVLASRGDYEWSRNAVRKYNLPQRCKAVLFSTVSGALDPKSVVEWLLEDRLDVRLQLQMHKYIWPPGQRGV